MVTQGRNGAIQQRKLRPSLAGQSGPGHQCVGISRLAGKRARNPLSEPRHENT